MAAYIHGVQAAKERLARARKTLIELQSQEALAARINAEADELERAARELAKKARRPAYQPRAGENRYGGPEGLAAAVAEIDEYNARKRAERMSTA